MAKGGNSSECSDRCSPVKRNEIEDSLKQTPILNYVVKVLENETKMGGGVYGRKVSVPHTLYEVKNPAPGSPF